LKNHSEIVKLEPYLPWHATHGNGEGLAIGIAEGLLRLKFTSPAPFPATGDFGIQLSSKSSPALPVTGHLTPTSIGGVFDLEVAEGSGRTHLRELLTGLRKKQHIEICRSEDVESSDRFTGFEQFSLLPETLPELDYVDINTATTFLGRAFSLPLLITGMTGGVARGEEINRRLAHAALTLNIPMGVGSQRIALEKPDLTRVFNVKKESDGLFLIGNLGCAQLHAADGIELCMRAIDMIHADALAIHVNVIQECIQVEGDRAFKGVLCKLEELCRKSPIPIVVKEVGAGMSPATALRLREAGVSALDVGGRGGTSWGYIEGLRSTLDETRHVAETFRNWGIPTAFSLRKIRSSLVDMPLIATGGIRNGLVAAKALALGANMVGIGLPLMRAALEDEEGPLRLLAIFKRELTITMLATGCQTLHDLSHRLCHSPYPLEAELHQTIQTGRNQGYE
jgi:isopentenyl-diphosphate delta-isomerase